MSILVSTNNHGDSKKTTSFLIWRNFMSTFFEKKPNVIAEEIEEIEIKNQNPFGTDIDSCCNPSNCTCNNGCHAPGEIPSLTMP